MTPNEKLRYCLTEMVSLWERVVVSFPVLENEIAYKDAKQVLKETEPKPNDNDNT